ncbi:pyruvate, phosphate dikinase, partial [Candidatus Binatia bacterium]|nr:pyruvate, phosphate dikinase [Candidatus Binatia bacterium]
AQHERSGAARSDDDRRRALALLDDCRAGGTLPFAVIARHAFLSEALLRSAVSRGALAPERLEALRAARRTVSTELAHDLAAAREGLLSRDELLRRYGHLRPGSFDVTAARWDARPSLLDAPPAAGAAHDEPEPFFLTERESADLTRLAREIGLRVDGRGLIAYANAAVVGRERAKLLLTRHLSSALEHLAAWAARHGWSRHDLACLTLADLRTAGDQVHPRTRRLLDERIAARRAEEDVLRAVRLGALLRDARDLYVQLDDAHAPTFVTTRVATGRPLFLDGRRETDESPGGRVICIESADPGFDWIFTHRIAGLVTRFGGGNSHMAIRCVEHRVPAAIGVGEALFDRMRGAAAVELRCHDRQVRCLVPVASA